MARVVNARRLGTAGAIIEFLDTGAARIRSSAHTQVRIVHLTQGALADLADALPRDSDRFLFDSKGEGNVP